MTRMQLERAVAGATGESLRTVRRLGFGPLRASTTLLAPEDLVLAVDCPFCGRPTRAAGGPERQELLAECDRCHVEFDYRSDEVYADGLGELDRAAHAA